MNDLMVVDTLDHISVSMMVSKVSLAAAEVSKLDDEIWYFNRLIVPPLARNKKVATKLMEKLVEILNKREIKLVCDINPYGDLDFEQLERFYKKFGFVNDSYYNFIRYPKEQVIQ